MLFNRLSQAFSFWWTKILENGTSDPFNTEGWLNRLRWAQNNTMESRLIQATAHRAGWIYRGKLVPKPFKNTR